MRPQGKASYLFAIVFALVLHAGVFYAMWHYQGQLVKITKVAPDSVPVQLVSPTLIPLQPEAITSRLLVEQPPPPKPDPVPVKEPEPKPEKKKAKAKPKPKPKTKPKAKPKVKPKPEPEPVKEEPKKADDLDDLVRDINDKPAVSNKPVTPELRIAQRYVGRIQRQIESAWVQPPNVQYREMAGLQVLIRLVIEPSGRLVNARILQSSGNTQFDRSAINAVYRVGQFEVPSDSDIFQQYFKQLNINYTL